MNRETEALASELNFRREERRIAQDAALGEKTGTVVLEGGKVYYRKPNDQVKYGPFNSTSEAKEAAQKAGVALDADPYTNAGMKAAKEGKPRSANPYPKGSFEWDLWDQAWALSQKNALLTKKSDYF